MTEETDNQASTIRSTLESEATGLVALLVGALREAGELSDPQFESGHPGYIADGLERLKTRAMA